MELIQLSPYTIAALGHTIEFAKASRRPSNKELQRNAVFPLPKGAIEVKRNYWPQNCQHLTVWTLFCFFCLFVFVVETLECICKFCPQFYGVWSWWLIIFSYDYGLKYPLPMATDQLFHWQTENKQTKHKNCQPAPVCLSVFLVELAGHPWTRWDPRLTARKEP